MMLYVDWKDREVASIGVATEGTILALSHSPTPQDTHFTK